MTETKTCNKCKKKLFDVIPSSGDKYKFVVPCSHCGHKNIIEMHEYSGIVIAGGKKRGRKKGTGTKSKTTDGSTKKTGKVRRARKGTST